MLILAIDADVDVQKTLQSRLEGQGYRTLVHGNGPDAIAYLTDASKQKPDLILCEAYMPGMGGYEIRQRARTLGVQCPFLFLSTKKLTAEELKGLGVGENDSIKKPLDLQELETKIGGYVKPRKETSASGRRFKDEWLARIAISIPGVTPTIVEKLRASGAPSLYDALLTAGVVPKGTLGQLVADALKMPLCEVPTALVDRRALSLVPERICRRSIIVPLKADSETIEVAMANPRDLDALEDIRSVSGREPKPKFCPVSRVETMLAELFDPDAVVYEMLEKVGDAGEVETLGPELAVSSGVETEVRRPVMMLTNSLIAKAIAMGASDIHIEHEDTISVVRYRIDGVMRQIMSLPPATARGPLVSRIKIMANLDVAEHMHPQDGRAKLRVNGVEIGLRVSTLPANLGEKVVIRILDQRAAEVPFDKLGMQPKIASRIEKMIRKEQGMLLVTGPTGSGKTTTLYSALNLLRSGDINIVTVEDPVEYKLSGVTQVQINDKQGLTFAAVLRSVLRQDPDIIMVGEIRDAETGDTAFQAALTGHFVFSTLHTNDAISSISRLIDMGIERFKLAPGLVGITAQRLVRCLCSACLAPIAGDPAVLQSMKDLGLEPKQFEAPGCKECDFTGFKGRVALVELLEFDEELRNLISSGAESPVIRAAALKSKALHTIHDDLLYHLSKGHTAMSEVQPFMMLDSRKPEPAASVAPAPIAAAPAAKVAAPASPVKPAQPAAPVVAKPATPAPAPIPARPAAPPAPVRPAVPSPIPIAAVHRPVATEGTLTTTPSKHILICDDDHLFRGLVRTALEISGYDVEEAEGGAMALRMVSQNLPRAMIVDLNMPEMTGIAVIGALRKDRGLLRLPILMLTSEDDAKSQASAFEAGADDYVLKSVRPSLIIARLQAILRRVGA